MIAVESVGLKRDFLPVEVLLLEQVVVAAFVVGALVGERVAAEPVEGYTALKVVDRVAGQAVEAQVVERLVFAAGIAVALVVEVLVAALVGVGTEEALVPAEVVVAQKEHPIVQVVRPVDRVSAGTAAASVVVY